MDALILAFKYSIIFGSMQTGSVHSDESAKTQHKNAVWSLQFETGCSKTRRIKNVKLSASQSRDKKDVRAYYDYYAHQYG